jgi:hypothetical protein
MGRARAAKVESRTQRKTESIGDRFDFVGESKIDERKRVSLAKVLPLLRKSIPTSSTLRFMIYVNEAGQILLEPSVSVPLREAWLYKNPEALAKVEEGLAQLGRNPPRSLGSFAKFADDEID